MKVIAIESLAGNVSRSASSRRALRWSSSALDRSQAFASFLGTAICSMHASEFSGPSRLHRRVSPARNTWPAAGSQMRSNLGSKSRPKVYASR